MFLFCAILQTADYSSTSVDAAAAAAASRASNAFAYTHSILFCLYRCCCRRLAALLRLTSAEGADSMAICKFAALINCHAIVQKRIPKFGCSSITCSNDDCDIGRGGGGHYVVVIVFPSGGSLKRPAAFKQRDSTRRGAMNQTKPNWLASRSVVWSVFSGKHVQSDNSVA